MDYMLRRIIAAIPVISERILSLSAFSLKIAKEKIATVTHKPPFIKGYKIPPFIFVQRYDKIPLPMQLPMPAAEEEKKSAAGLVI